MTPQEIAKLCFVLSNKWRVLLLELIINNAGFLCQVELEDRLRAAGCPITQPTISHHLSVLRRAGLVDSQASGLYEYYTFRTERLSDLAHALLGYVAMGREVLV